MKQNQIYYTLSLSAPSRTKGVLCVVAAFKGQAQGRKSYVIDGLVNPDYRFWDNKAKRFVDGSITAVDNNPIIDKVCALCDELIQNPKVTTTQEFVDALVAGKAPKTVTTLGDFVNQIIYDMRNGTGNKRPSRHYQNYINLLHKLEAEGELIDVPIQEITNKHFIQFSQFLLSIGGCNYTNLMKYFKQIHTKAWNLELNDHQLRFKYTDAAPITEDIEKQASLSLEQYKQFEALDLSIITQHGVDAEKRKQLYHDFCIFLYESKSRPADVIRIHEKDLIEKNGCVYWKYVPEKKKNAKERDKVAYTPLSKTALAIISKYKGQSAQGYVFPFAVNNYAWDFNDAKSWNAWNLRKGKTLEMIRNWLRKVKDILAIDFDLTLYTFRRSALTHACMADDANIMRIALSAGTSYDMLQKHYVSNIC